MIGVVNPTSLGLLKPPGEWGAGLAGTGADIVCGEGQALGVPLSGEARAQDPVPADVIAGER